MRSVLLLLLMILAASSPSQSVYKCMQGGTTVFSQKPCADDPAKMETVDTSRSLRTGTGGSIAELGEMAAISDLRLKCSQHIGAVATRYRNQYGTIAAQISGLERTIARANNNLAGATMESGLRQQIAGLVTERGTLRAAESAESTAERERCRQDEQAANERHSQAQGARDASREAEAEAIRRNAETEAAAQARAKSD